MPTDLHRQPPAARQIFVSRPEAKVDPAELGQTLTWLGRTRRITERDELVLETLQDLGVLSLDQLQRLFWPEAKASTAADRLSKLLSWHLLRMARQPWRKFPADGLSPEAVYGVGPGGFLWFGDDEPENYAYHLIDPAWVWRQLRLAEFYTRLHAGLQTYNKPVSLRWFNPLMEPWLADLTQITPAALLQLGHFVFWLEPDRPDWAKVVAGYDRLAQQQWSAPPELELPAQPQGVLVITVSTDRIAELAWEVAQRREAAVAYLFVAWPDLLASPNPLTAPIWLRLAPGKNELQRVNWVSE
ncbi:MAG: hypothetical protein Kow0031_14400 [Anaerolineae bacterium]